MLVFVILGAYVAVSESLRFDLESGHSKCISEEIRVNSMTVGKYSIVNPNDNQPLPDSQKIIVRVFFFFLYSFFFNSLLIIEFLLLIELDKWVL